MSMFSIFNVSGSAVSAQSQRLNVVASNLANADAVAGPDGKGYKAQALTSIERALVSLEKVFVAMRAGESKRLLRVFRKVNIRQKLYGQRPQPLRFDVCGDRTGRGKRKLHFTGDECVKREAVALIGNLRDVESAHRLE